MNLNQEIMSENPGKGEETQSLKEWENMKRMEKINKRKRGLDSRREGNKN